MEMEMEGGEFLRNFLELHGMGTGEREEEGKEEIEENVSGYFRTAEDEEEERKESDGGKDEKTHAEGHPSSSQGASLGKAIAVTVLKLFFVFFVVSFLTVRLFAPKHEERLPFADHIELSNK